MIWCVPASFRFQHSSVYKRTHLVSLRSVVFPSGHEISRVVFVNKTSEIAFSSKCHGHDASPGRPRRRSQRPVVRFCTGSAETLCTGIPAGNPLR